MIIIITIETLDLIETIKEINIITITIKGIIIKDIIIIEVIIIKKKNHVQFLNHHLHLKQVSNQMNLKSPKIHKIHQFPYHHIWKV